MDSTRQKRQEEIQKALTFIQSSLPYPEPGGYKGFLTQLVCNLLDEGNDSLKEEDWEQAVKDFSEGVQVAQYAAADDIDVPETLLEGLFVSRAMAYHSMREYEHGVQDCDSALEVCVGSRQALYCKALCLKELGLHREAYNCTKDYLMAEPLDKQMNDLAQELACRLGLKIRKAYVSTKEEVDTARAISNGNTFAHAVEVTDAYSSNGLNSLSDIKPVGFSTMPLPSVQLQFDSLPLPSPYITYGSSTPLDNHQPVSLSTPISDPMGDSELMGEDLDSLLDCFPSEPEATQTHLQAAFPSNSSAYNPTQTSTFDPTNHSQYPTVLSAPLLWYPPTVLLPPPPLLRQPPTSVQLARPCRLPTSFQLGPQHQPPPSVLLGPTPQLHTPMQMAPPHQLPTYVLPAPPPQLPASVLLAPPPQLPAPVLPGPTHQLHTSIQLAPPRQPPAPVLPAPSPQLPSSVLPAPTHQLPISALPDPPPQLPAPVLPGPTPQLPQSVPLASTHQPPVSVLPGPAPRPPTSVPLAPLSQPPTPVQPAPTSQPPALPPPSPQLPQSILPAPTPQLPPAFFTSAVSQLNSLDTLSPLGGGDGPTASTLDTLDLPGSLDVLDSFSSSLEGGGGDTSKAGLSTVLNTAALDSLDGLDSLDDLLGSPPSLEAGKDVKEPRTAPHAVEKHDLLDDSLDESLDFFDALENIPQSPAVGRRFDPKRDVNALDTLDSLDSLDVLNSFPSVEGARAGWPAVVVGGGGLDSLSDFSLPGTNSSHVAASHAKHSAKNNYKATQVSNPLASTHDFMQACSTCFPREGRGIYSFVYKPDLDHRCKRDILLCRRKANSSLDWNRVRPRMAMVKFEGPYVLCRELLSSGELGLCKFGEECTFAFNQCEIDMWTEERKGTLNRNLLFQTLAIKEDPSVSVARLLQQYDGIFMFLCQECYDGKPRIISKRSRENHAVCSNRYISHKFDANKCLVYVVMTTTVNYRKIRPLCAQYQLEMCGQVQRYGCQMDNSCPSAHSLIELQTWTLQRETGMSPDEIVKESIKYNQKNELNKPKMEKPPSSSGGAVGGAAARPKGRGKSLNLRMKFACAQCWRDGLISEPDKALKYCTSKASHIWTKERRVLLVMSMDKNKWVQVRPLPHAKNFPLQYDICAHIYNLRKCTYSGNCTFAHSDEEKDLWDYMKDNDLTNMQQIYDMWLSLTRHSRQSDGALLTQPAPLAEEKYIAMPTDYAEPMSGFHCRLCGRHSNGERQWQQHISSEKHKDRVFAGEGEDESLTWKYRFPAPRFELCPRRDSGCTEGASCDSAHSPEELLEWKERRDFLRRKLAKAREDMLIMPDELDFGKYNFLLQD